MDEIMPKWGVAFAFYDTKLQKDKTSSVIGQRIYNFWISAQAHFTYDISN